MTDLAAQGTSARPRPRTDVKISRILFTVVRFTFLGLLILAVVFPLLWVSSTSLKSYAENQVVPPTLFPESPTFRNYQLQLNLGNRSEGQEFGGGGISPLPQYILNGVIISTATTVAVIVMALMAGYSFSRFAIPGREATLMFFLASQMFPFIALIVSIYLMYRNLGLLNTYVGIVIAITGILLPFAVWIMKGFCDSIEKEFDEAALMEGAGRLRILFTIIAPVLKPAIVAVGMFSFLGAWNHLFFVLIIGKEDRVRTVPLALLMQMHNLRENHGSLAASLIIVSVPIVVVYLALQRQFAEGLTAGSIKG